jgi:hypothetical protein
MRASRQLKWSACCVLSGRRQQGTGALQLSQLRVRAQVADLKAMCKERGISGYSKFRKSQLVRVLKEAMLVESE